MLLLLQDKLRYELISDGTSDSDRGLQYFAVHPDNGSITVTQDLRTDATKTKQFNVSNDFKDRLGLKMQRRMIYLQG